MALWSSFFDEMVLRSNPSDFTRLMIAWIDDGAVEQFV